MVNKHLFKVLFSFLGVIVLGLILLVVFDSLNN